MRVNVDPNPDQHQYLSIFRRYVLAPMRAAERDAERERTEVARERDAFEQFAERVPDIPRAAPREPGLPSRTRTTTTSSEGTTALRRAYADTVMAVPHYDEEYGESVVENAAAELGPELATLMDPATGPPFGHVHEGALVASAEKQAAQRHEFYRVLDTEIASLESSRHELTTVLDELETTIVPSGYRQQFEDTLTRTLHARQSTLSRIDGHDLCTYLYADEPWTYPVLTAVARILDSVTMGD